MSSNRTWQPNLDQVNVTSSLSQMSGHTTRDDLFLPHTGTVGAHCNDTHFKQPAWCVPRAESPVSLDIRAPSFGASRRPTTA